MEPVTLYNNLHMTEYLQHTRLSSTPLCLILQKVVPDEHPFCIFRVGDSLKAWDIIMIDHKKKLIHYRGLYKNDSTNSDSKRMQSNN